MKFSRLYSNKEAVFNSISFNQGLNVVFGHITNLNQSDKDTHNLGKTTLLHLIDYMLLKQVGNDFFLKKYSQFDDFIFFIELQLNSGKMLTIKRGPSIKVSIKIHSQTMDCNTLCDDEERDYCNIGLDSAREILDTELGFFFLGTFAYRNGLCYSLRTQDDYSDVFRLPKYSRSPDINWKPYLFHVMGLNSTFLINKYELSKKIEQETIYELRESAKLGDNQSYDKIETILNVEKEEFEKFKLDLEEFNILGNDLEINKELINSIEQQVSKLNDDLYNTNRDIAQIEDILSQKIEFNINMINKVFAEVEMIMPEYLMKKYEDLIDFNTKVSTERKKHFGQKLKDLKLKSTLILQELDVLNNDKMNKLAHLRSGDFFEKYKNTQDMLNKKSMQIGMIEERKKTYLELEKIKEKIHKMELEIEDVNKQIDQNIRADNEILLLLKKTFTDLTKTILNVKGIISLNNNSNGNVEFSCDVYNNSGELETRTSESEGHSYKKLLSAIFDLSLVITNSSKSFYRTVFHDGVLEGDDDRKKTLFIDNARMICDKHNIQYIMTMIESDLPEIEVGKKYEFQDGEIVLNLSDSDNGRLFKMPIF